MSTLNAFQQVFVLSQEVITMAQFVAAIITLNEAVCEPFYCIIMAEP